MSHFLLKNLSLFLSEAQKQAEQENKQLTVLVNGDKTRPLWRSRIIDGKFTRSRFNSVGSDRAFKIAMNKNQKPPLNKMQ